VRPTLAVSSTSCPVIDNVPRAFVAVTIVNEYVYAVAASGGAKTASAAASRGSTL
jgi:hypothetical protein